MEMGILGHRTSTRGQTRDPRTLVLVPKAGNVVILKLERRGHQPLVNRDENAKTFVGVTINNAGGVSVESPCKRCCPGAWSKGRSVGNRARWDRLSQVVSNITHRGVRDKVDTKKCMLGDTGDAFVYLML